MAIDARELKELFFFIMNVAQHIQGRGTWTWHAGRALILLKEIAEGEVTLVGTTAEQKLNQDRVIKWSEEQYGKQKADEDRQIYAEINAADPDGRKHLEQIRAEKELAQRLRRAILTCIEG